MAAGGDHHKAPPAHDVAGSMLVGMTVRDELPALLLLGEMIDRRRLDQCIGDYSLE